MHLGKLLLGLGVVAIVAAAALVGRDQPKPRELDVPERMALAAKQLLAGLRPELKVKAQFAFDAPERLQWHFYPTTPWPRKGAVLVDMNAQEKDLVKALLRAGTSEKGYQTALQLMALEGILRDIENTAWARKYRNPDLYHVFLFGEPGPKGKWGWRIEGHHLVLTYVIEDGKLIGATPTFFGANPAEVMSGPHEGLRLLAKEEDLARRLYTSLDAGQRMKATISEQPPFDILTEVKTKPRALPMEGIAWADLKEPQVKTLRELLDTYAGKQPEEVRKQLWKELDGAGLEKIRFGWSGASEPGQPLYYRIQGPTFVVEYCNSQNKGNHAHSVWRNYTNDFGMVE